MLITTPPRRPRLADAIVAEIAGQIIRGDLPAGHTLQAEPHLCERFGVSRTVVREAMAQLARDGLVRIRQGAGTVVLSRDHWHELDPGLLRVRAAQGLIGDLVPDLLAIRRIVEIEVAGEAARHRTDHDLARLASQIDIMDANIDEPAVYNSADISFHLELIAATGNELLLQLMRPINELRRIGSVITTSRARAVVLASMDGHRAIFDAVIRRDADAARAAMAAHIAQFERDMLQALASDNGMTRSPRNDGEPQHPMAGPRSVHARPVIRERRPSRRGRERSAL